MLDAKNVYSVFITETNAHVNSTLNIEGSNKLILSNILLVIIYNNASNTLLYDFTWQHFLLMLSPTPVFLPRLFGFYQIVH